MKKYVFLLTCFLLPILSYCQSPDTAKHKKFLTTSPFLGGVNVTDIVSPVKVNNSTMTMQQPIADIGIPVYKDFSTVNTVLIKTGIRYRGLFLSNEEKIGESAFHSVTVPLLLNYSLSRTKTISFIGLATAGSDFKRGIEANDILYTLGVRLGFRPSKSFKWGVTLVYTRNYSGKFLLPLPDFDWTINDNWSLTAVLPSRASLKRRLSNSQSLGLTVGLDGSMYRLNTTNQPQYIHLRQNSAGLLYDLTLSRRWKFTMVAGHTFMQRLETFNMDQKVPFEGFGKLNDRVANISYRQNSFIFQGGVSYQF
jgi:hypothetical protein